MFCKKCSSKWSVEFVEISERSQTIGRLLRLFPPLPHTSSLPNVRKFCVESIYVNNFAENRAVSGMPLCFLSPCAVPANSPREETRFIRPQVKIFKLKG